MKPNELIARIQTELQQRFRTAGRGSVAKVQKALNLNPGYFRDQRRPERRHVDLRILLRALEELTIEPSEFFAASCGVASAEAIFRADGQRLARQWRRLPKILQVLDRTADGAAAGGEGTEPEFFDQLDRQRFTEPNRILRLARQGVQGGPHGDRLKWLALYASAARVKGRLEEAHVVLTEGLTLADEWRAKGRRAELLQRAGYVVSDRGQNDQAIALSEEACLVYVELNDRSGIGRTFVDRGIWHGHNDMYERAIELLSSGLGYLEDDGLEKDQVYRRSCLLALARAHLELDHLAEAHRYAAAACRETAAADADQRQGDELANLLWFQASIAKRLGDLETAVQCMAQVVDLHSSMPLNAALATLELARLQLALGEIEASRQTARTMTVYMTTFEDNPLISAALVEVLRLVISGRQVSAALLDRTIETIERERARQA